MGGQLINNREKVCIKRDNCVSIEALKNDIGMGNQLIVVGCQNYGSRLLGFLINISSGYVR